MVSNPAVKPAAYTTDAGDTSVPRAVQTHEKFVASETLATSVAYAAVTSGTGFTGEAGEGEQVTVMVSRA